MLFRSSPTAAVAKSIREEEAFLRSVAVRRSMIAWKVLLAA
jgi:hypothetical protein